jgi:hypothetical protein
MQMSKAWIRAADRELFSRRSQSIVADGPVPRLRRRCIRPFIRNHVLPESLKCDFPERKSVLPNTLRRNDDTVDELI